MTDQLAALDDLYLEGSFLLGMIADGRQLRFCILFALTSDHPAHRPPPQEQHCYRRGEIVADGVTILAQRPGPRPNILIDPDGTFDFGSIELYGRDANYLFVSEWIELEFLAESVTVELDRSVGREI
jgi:hypothetical protein